MEDKLWGLLEVHRFLERVYALMEVDGGESGMNKAEELQMAEIGQKLSEVAYLCDEWWEVTHEDNINFLDKVFKHDLLRRAVRQCLIAILLTVTTCYAYSIEKCTDSNEEQEQPQKKEDPLISLRVL